MGLHSGTRTAIFPAMADTITIDYALCMEQGVGSQGGLRDKELDAEAPRFEQAVAQAQEDASSGRIGFWQLPQQADLPTSVAQVADALPPGLTDVLVLGIGGSSLGARAFYQALCGPVETQGLVPAKGPRLHLPDNSDPFVLKHLLDALPAQTTCVLVISKSGGTVETAAQMLIVQSWLEGALGETQARKQLVAITDPETGSLRALAQEQQWHTLAVPANVGGRFSVLSPVGLLPALLCGVDIKALLSGAAAMAERCQTPKLRENPAGVLAAVHVLQHRLRQRPLHVLMPYSDQLRPFAAWFVQLWAESLGKRTNLLGETVEQGPTPLPAVGATDQHAQVQLFMEGPRDKVITFLKVTQPATDLTIPSVPGASAYLGGHSMAELLAAELQGTTQALASDGRPSITVEVPRVDAQNLGALFYLYEAATAYAGALYGINTFDQPGVELGKRLAFGLLGRSGYEDTAKEVQAALAARPTKYRT